MKTRFKNFFSTKYGILTAGSIIGLIAVMLVRFGNPANMGICVACFLRDSVGALGFHRAAPVQYMRPELAGLILGSMLAAFLAKELKPRGGSAPLVRFFLGFFAMIGALAFLGCPWRVIIRIAGGDLNGLVGLAGLVTGIFVGVLFLKSGYSLGRTRAQTRAAGLIMPILSVVLLVFVIFKISPSENAPLFFSSGGPGSKHAAIAVSLLAGTIVGIVAQRSRFCTIGSFRDIFVIRDFHLFFGIAAMFVVILVYNIFTGNFNLGFESQPVAHSFHIWNFLGMGLSGIAFALAGGCPGRQFIMSGEGDNDSVIFIIGMGAGAAFAHNFQTAASGAGPGKFTAPAVITGIVVCIIIGTVFSRSKTRGV
ncbi:MAG: YedE family putative selenium transporter [Spirochaetes bacterium]|jgi:YedE family putative selenium metabolism protein|nr:YedE family putative selenium transporter [Spirochaetota bacterium]